MDLQSCETLAIIERIRQLQPKIEAIMEREDLRSKLRAKQSWCCHGDQNTQYFHSWANQRRKSNNIRIIIDEHGHVWIRKKDVCRVFVGYYEQMFQSQGSVGVEDCLNNVESRVAEEMNARLLRPFMKDEVRSAMIQMHPLKSPGPDGYSTIFFFLIKNLGF